MTLSDYKAERRLSLTQLALQLGVPVSTANDWVTGRREPHSSALPRIIERTGGWVRAVDLRRDAALAAAAEVATGHGCHCPEKVSP